MQLCARRVYTLPSHFHRFHEHNLSFFVAAGRSASSWVEKLMSKFKYGHRRKIGSLFYFAETRRAVEWTRYCLQSFTLTNDQRVQRSRKFAVYDQVEVKSIKKKKRKWAAFIEWNAIACEAKNCWNFSFTSASLWILNRSCEKSHWTNSKKWLLFLIFVFFWINDQTA